MSKPPGLPPPKHRHLWHGTCYACICRVCNLKLCRYHERWDRCAACRRIHNRAILDCDQFQSKYEHRVFRIKRDALNKKPSVAQMVYELWLKDKG